MCAHAVKELACQSFAGYVYTVVLHGASVYIVGYPCVPTQGLHSEPTRRQSSSQPVDQLQELASTSGFSPKSPSKQRRGLTAISGCLLGTT